MSAETDDGPFPEDGAIVVDFCDYTDNAELVAKLHDEAGTDSLIADLFGFTADGGDESLSDRPRAVPSKLADLGVDENYLKPPPAPTPRAKRGRTAESGVSRGTRSSGASSGSRTPSQSSTASQSAPPSAPPSRAPSPSDEEPEEGQLNETVKKRKRRRKRKANRDKPLSAQANKIWSDFKRLNRKAIDEARLNKHVVDFELKSLVTPDQQQRAPGVDEPKYKQYHQWKFDDGTKTRLAVDKNGIPLVIVCRNWLGMKAHDILFDLLMKFGREVGVEVRKAADKNTRDAAKAYTRRSYRDELHGVFQLVTIWRALGRKRTIPGPSTDVFTKVINFNKSLELLSSLRVVSKRIDHFIRLFDPQQHAIFTLARDTLCAQNAGYKLLSTLDSSFFHGRSIIYNRETPEHRDRRDMKLAWTPLVTTGEYERGVLRVLDLDIEYMPGTLVLLRGGILKHRVTFSGGQRVAIAHFMHQNVLADAGVTSLPLTPVT